MGPDAASRYYVLYHLDSGLVLSSKDVHFHEVPLDKVEKIDLVLKYYTRRLDKSTLGADFKEFIHFRSVTHTKRLFENKPESISFQSWTLGWTDHTNEYLDEYLVKTGDHLNRTVIPRDFTKNPSHFHKDALKVGV